MLLQGNLTLEASNNLISLPTIPLVDSLEIARPGACRGWDVPAEWPPRRPAAFKIETLFLPSSTDDNGSSASLGASVKEQWVRWNPSSCPSSPRKFTVDALPFLADAFRPLPESYGLSGNWYPTVSYGVDVRRGGEWEWLFLRVKMYEVRHGRFGMDVVICADVEGEGLVVVATSRHVALIVGGERNVKGRIEKKGEIKGKL